ncbi:hypothetical protein E4K66_03720 [Bradyrhizobium frederickii]|uniref:Uncharacterized protein n=1 Tax=Bradyrhizobium frederickii TaxID=2560054 RepID=A0A4Y9LEV9_9BRAD|nr:hypothetical protein [Bradyrhizobium frederickii]TFV41449.1 hypothetical protein E4K66_03720 [Bradyrhizobium frederickii]
MTRGWLGTFKTKSAKTTPCTVAGALKSLGFLIGDDNAFGGNDAALTRRAKHRQNGIVARKVALDQ